MASARGLIPPWSEGERCTCGHRWSDHADRTEYGQTLQCEGRCTVCTCNRFDWDPDAPRDPQQRGDDAMKGNRMVVLVAMRGGRSHLMREIADRLRERGEAVWEVEGEDIGRGTPPAILPDYFSAEFDRAMEAAIRGRAPASPAPSEEAPALDPDKCDEEVFRDGEDVGVYGSLSRPEAQRLCADLRALTGWRWDWNYAAGRVVLRVLRGPGAPSSEAGTRGEGEG